MLKEMIINYLNIVAVLDEGDGEGAHQGDQRVRECAKQSISSRIAQIVDQEYKCFNVNLNSSRSNKKLGICKEAK